MAYAVHLCVDPIQSKAWTFNLRLYFFKEEIGWAHYWIIALNKCFEPFFVPLQASNMSAWDYAIMKHIWFYSIKRNNDRTELSDDSCAGSISRSGVCSWLLQCWKALTRADVWCIDVPHWRSPVRLGFTPNLTPSCIIRNCPCLESCFSLSERNSEKKNIYDVHTQNTPPAPTRTK